ALVEVDGDLPRGPCHLEEPGESGQRARSAEAEDDEPVRADAGEARRPRRLAGQLDLEAEKVALQEDIGRDHHDEGRDHAPVHAGLTEFEWLNPNPIQPSALFAL